MIDHRAKILFAFLLVIQLSATLEKKDCRNWDQSDQVISTRDYGVSGIAGPVNLNLEPELQPGSVISVVSKTASRGQISLLNDDREYLLHIDARTGLSERAELLLTTYMNGLWRADYKELINPIGSGAKVTTTIIYEPKGYRIFINGGEIAFYDHRKFQKPTVLNIEHDLVYKVLYLTTVRN